MAANESNTPLSPAQVDPQIDFHSLEIREILDETHASVREAITLLLGIADIEVR